MFTTVSKGKRIIWRLGLEVSVNKKFEDKG